MWISKQEFDCILALDPIYIVSIVHLLHTIYHILFLWIYNITSCAYKENTVCHYVRANFRMLLKSEQTIGPYKIRISFKFLLSYNHRSAYGGSGKCSQCGQLRQLNSQQMCGPCHLKNKISQT